MWTPDPIHPDLLAKSHPLSCDADTGFKEIGHEYGIRNGDVWMTEGLLSTTAWLKRFLPVVDEQKFVFMAIAVAKSVNKYYLGEWRDGDAPWPDKHAGIVDAETMNSMRKGDCPAKTFESRLTDPEFVRLPYYTDAALLEAFERWTESETKDAVTFNAIFKDPRRVMALPPMMDSGDVRRAWPKCGTKLHYEIELHLNGAGGHQATKEWLQFKRFMCDVTERGLKPYRTELSMSVPKLKVCGQADGLFWDGVDRFILFDWKRTDKLHVDPLKDKYAKDKSVGTMLPPWGHRRADDRSKFTLQVNVYRHMLKRYGIDVKESYVVEFHSSFGEECRVIPIKHIEASACDEDAVAFREMVRMRGMEVDL